MSKENIVMYTDTADSEESQIMCHHVVIDHSVKISVATTPSSLSHTKTKTFEQNKGSVVS